MLGGMMKTREAKIRALMYFGLALLAVVTIAVVAYATTMPGWDSVPTERMRGSNK